jgi:hypothetical protein
VPALHALQKDYLTTDEVEQVRLVQEPNERILLYLTFARQRIDMLETLFSQEKTGRSILIHDKLDEYTKILEAIDTVTDDALRRKLPVDKGVAELVKAQEEFIPKLKKFEELNPKDLARYKFSLTQAIETTEDSLDLARQDLKERGTAVAAREAEAKKELEALMQPKDIETRRAQEKKAAAAEAAKRKAPTLRRKGEVVPAKP